MSVTHPADQILRGNNIPFTGNDLEYGRQYRFPDQGVIVMYHSGKVVAQGKDSELRRRALELLSDGVLPESLVASNSSVSIASAQYNNRVFIVYGHDGAAREQLELVLRRLKLEPVVLQNLPASGDTIIEKLEANMDVTFACILLTPDDEGHVRDKPEKKQYRARQNVVLELGMFLVKLGRKRVAILYKGDIELPSDISGLLYIPFENRVDEVKERLAADLQEAGFQINIKDLLG